MQLFGFLRNAKARIVAVALALFAGIAACTSAAVTGVALSVVLTVVGLIVLMAVVAALAPNFFDSLASVIENFTEVELGTSDAANIAETIIQVLAILIAIGGALVLVTILLKRFGVKGV